MLKKLLGNRLMKNVLGNYVLKVISMLLSYVATPLYMNYFSSNRVLGVWFTIVSVINWLILLDFGVGSSARNRLVVAFNKEDNNEVDKIISSGLFINTVIIFFLILVQFFLFEVIDCFKFLGISHSDISEMELKAVIHILCIGALLRIYGSFLANIYYSLQKAMASSIMSISSNVIIIIYMLIQNKLICSSNVIELAIVHAIAYNIPTLVASWDLLFVKLKKIRLHLKSISRGYVNDLAKVGLHFFGLQLLITIAFGTKELLISRFVGAEYVVEYNIYQKIIGIASTIFGLALVSIWSEVTERYIRKEYTRVLSLYKKGLRFIEIISIGQVILMISFPFINDIWLNDKAVRVSIYAMIIFATYNVAYMIIMLNYNFLCGMEKLGKLSFSLVIILVLGVGLSALFTMHIKDWNMINIAITIGCLPAIGITSIDVIRSCRAESV